MGPCGRDAGALAPLRSRAVDSCPGSFASRRAGGLGGGKKRERNGARSLLGCLAPSRRAAPPLSWQVWGIWGSFGGVLGGWSSFGCLVKFLVFGQVLSFGRVWGFGRLLRSDRVLGVWLGFGFRSSFECWPCFGVWSSFGVLVYDLGVWVSFGALVVFGALGEFGALGRLWGTLRGRPLACSAPKPDPGLRRLSH